MSKDYYAILGVLPNCSEQEIKIAYRKLSKKFHPDTNDGDTFFESKLKEVIEAYEVLSDYETRRRYDEIYNNRKTQQKSSESSSSSNDTGTSNHKENSTSRKDKFNNNKKYDTSRSTHERRKSRYVYLQLAILIFAFAIIKVSFKSFINSNKHEIPPISSLDMVKFSSNGNVIEFEKITSDTAPPIIIAGQLQRFCGTLRYKKFYGPPNFGRTPSVDKLEYSYILELKNNLLLADSSFLGPNETIVVNTIHVIEDIPGLDQYVDKDVIIYCSIVAAHTGHHHGNAISWDWVNIVSDDLSKKYEKKSIASEYLGKILEVDSNYNDGPGVRLRVEQRLITGDLEREYNYEEVKIGSEEWYAVNIDSGILSHLGERIRFTCHREGSGGFLWLDTYTTGNSMPVQ